MAYRCEQCGSPEIVALSQLYEQGTRSFSGRFTSGVSQSYTAKAASPPRPRGYLRALFGVGIPYSSFVSSGVLAGFSAILQHPQEHPSLLKVTVAVPIVVWACMLFLGLLFTFPQDRPLQPRGLSTSLIRIGRTPSCAAVAESTL